MGLILFGTEKCDSDSETKNILTLKKLNLISKDDLKDIMKIGNFLIYIYIYYISYYKRKLK